MIEFRDIRKRLGRNDVLKGLSLRLESGQLGLLLGPNGAGKTTALRIAAGVLTEDDGAVYVGKAEVTAPERRRQFAYLPQGVAFQPRLNAWQLLRFYARALGAPQSAIGPALRLWGLEPHADKPSSALSGGLRQRLGLATVSLARADVLLLDEPGISLDAEWRERMQDWLREQAIRGRTTLVATHLLSEWDGRADRALLCLEGRVAEELNPSRLREEGSTKLRGTVARAAS